jgi:hypothetical protein
MLHPIVRGIDLGKICTSAVVFEIEPVEGICAARIRKPGLVLDAVDEDPKQAIAPLVAPLKDDEPLRQAA